VKIDNSQASAFWTCPLKWRERYENNLEFRTRSTDALDFGTRMHQLLEGRHLCLAGHPVRNFEPLADDSLESEAQLTFEAYCAQYPEEPFEVVAVEQYFEVPLPGGKHLYNGEFDGVTRMLEAGRAYGYTPGKLYLLETKTESRSSKSNLPEAWISRSQVGLYQWAAEQLYNEPFEGILLNVITRQSPKGNCGPVFRRDTLHRTKEQQLDAVKNLVWVADQLEQMRNSGFYPSNRNNCVAGYGWKCEYFDLHVTPEGRPSEELIQLKYKQAEEYLAGGL